MAQGLQQAPNTEAVQGRAEEHRHDQALVHILAEIGEHQVASRIGIRKQLLHQLVIEVGQLFEHTEARVRLDSGEVGGQIDDLRGLAGAVDECPFEGEVHIARDPLVLDRGKLPRHQRDRADRRQRREQGLQGAARLIHLVDEQRPGNTQSLELPHGRLQQHGLGRLGFGDDDGQVHGRQGSVRLSGQLLRTGTVDHRIVVAHEVETGEIELHRMAPRFRLRTGIPDLAVALAGGLQHGLHQARLAGAGGAHQRQRPHLA